jgi:hypothetical protein
MSLGTILKSIFGAGGFFSRLFKNVKEHADVLAISVTQMVKTAIEGSVAGWLAGIIDQLTKSNVAEDVLNLLKKLIPEVLAAELAIQGLPDNPTEADILAFENRILAAFSVTDNKSKLYTVLASQIYGIIQKTINNTDGKFADWVNAVEEAYQDYLADKEDPNATL